MKNVLLGTLVGVLAAVLWLYGLRPDIPYPRWMLQSFQHPWIFLVLLVVILAIATRFPVVAVLLFLLVAAMLMDMILYAKPITPAHIATNRPLPRPVGEPETPVVSNLEQASWMSGGPLSSVPLAQPSYPMFRGLMDPQPGEPAAF